MTKFKVGDRVRKINGAKFGPEGLWDDEVTHISGSAVYLLASFWQRADDLELVSDSLSSYNQDGGIKSNGGPSKYYDFEPDWATWNDFADYKSTHQWKEHSFHLGNVGKVLCRWGDKEGTTKDYDARKIVYSGLRTLLMLEGKDSVREYLNSLLEDNQFKTQGETGD